MTSLDLRVGALSLLGNPGTSRTLRLIFTADGAPVVPGPASVWIGGDERSPNDFTGAVEHVAVVAGNEATVTVPMPDSRELLRLTLDSALATIGTVAPSLRGTPDQDQTVQVNLGAVEVHVTGLEPGTDVDPVEVVTDPAAQAALSATFAPLGDDIFVPATMLDVVVGGATQGQYGRHRSARLIANSGVGTSIYLPPHWTSMRVVVEMVNDGNVDSEGGTLSLRYDQQPAGPGTTLTNFSGGTPIVVEVGDVGVEQHEQIAMSVPVDPTKRLGFSVLRLADLTLTNRLSILGVHFYAE